MLPTMGRDRGKGREAPPLEELRSVKDLYSFFR
jgi:hypothetical protein